MIRLLAYTIEPLNAIALSSLLSARPDITLVGACTNAPDAITSIVTESPDVVLLESETESDWNLLREVRSMAPAVKVVLWTREVNPESAYYAVECGVRGILRKTLRPDLVMTCVRAVHAGELWLDNSITDSILNGSPNRLAPREDQLLRLVSQGLKNREIALEMRITEGTVKVYLSRLFEKLGVRDRLELGLYGLRRAKSTGTALGHAPQLEHEILKTPSSARQRRRASADARNHIRRFAH